MLAMLGRLLLGSLCAASYVTLAEGSTVSEKGITCPNDCNDNGTCVHGHCVCQAGYTGPNCGLMCPDKCNGKGHCVDGQCVCFEGFSGDTCGEWRCPGDCDGNGRCVDRQCVCDEGFFGDDCSMVLAPKGLRLVNVTDVTLLVEWEHVRGAEYYVLSYCYEGEMGRGPHVQVPNTDNSYLITGLTPALHYLVKVYAVIKARQSEPDTIVATTDIDAPTNLIARDVTETSATVTWRRVRAEIDGYVLTYSSAEGSSQEIRVGAGATSQKLVSLKPGVLYTVFVWAYRGARASRKSSTEAETEIDAPRNLQVVNVQTESAALTWKAPQAQIEGYILRYRPENGSMHSAEKRLPAAETRLSLSGLTVGKKYIVTLIAYRGTKRSKEVETTFSTVGISHPFPMDCAQIMKNGKTESGVYTIYVAQDSNRPLEVFCDMTTEGGGWIVFQRRNSGKLDFMNCWKHYLHGFGELTEEFWLGLEKLYELTNTSTQYEVRFDLGLGTERVYAVYDNFKIAPARQKFKLTIGNYQGNAGDAMTYHQGRPFTTVDSDNDIALGNCTLTHRGAWWYKNCHLANLNGKYGDNRHSMGMNWEPWKGHLMSLDFSEIKIRPVGSGRRGKRSLKRRTSV